MSSTYGWNGSVTAGEFVSVDHSRVVDEINVALDAVNSADIEVGLNDMKLIERFIMTKEGRPGTYEVFEDFEPFFQSDGAYLDPEEYKKTYDKWTFNRQSYTVKNGSFEPEMFKKWKENGIDPTNELLDKTMKIIEKYNNVYKPNIVFETLMTVPTTAGGFYSKFGFARNTAVKKSAIIDYNPTATDGALGSLTRNHYRAINSNVGVSIEDVTFVKDYIAEYQGVDENNLICLGNSSSLTQFRNLYSDFSPTTETILNGGIVDGVQGWEVDGISLIKTKMLPRNMLLFIDGGIESLITKLVSTVAEYRGLSIIPENKLIKFEDVQSLQGSKFIILDEGYHLTGRLSGLWLDIDPARYDGSGTRLMQSAGFTELARRATTVRGLWNKEVIATA